MKNFDDFKEAELPLEKLNTPSSSYDGESDKKEIPMSATNEEKKSKIPLRWRGVFYIVLSAFFYAVMSLFVRLAGDIPTFQKAFFRNLIAAFIGLGCLIKSRSFQIKKGSLPALWGRSIAGTMGVLCNFYAIDTMNISDASILNKLAPFFSVIFSIFILKEKAGWKDLCLVGVAFVGALFVVKPSFELSQSAPTLIGAFGGMSAGLAFTLVRYLGKRGERPAMIVFFFSTFSCFSMLPMVILDYQPMELLQVLFLLLAGGAACAAQFCVTAAYTFTPAKEISVYDYSQVLFSAILGAVFLSQLPDYLSVIGYVVIIGAAVVKYLLGRKESKKAE